jgi:hypothetical protein
MTHTHKHTHRSRSRLEEAKDGAQTDTDTYNGQRELSPSTSVNPPTRKSIRKLSFCRRSLNLCLAVGTAKA